MPSRHRSRLLPAAVAVAFVHLSISTSAIAAEPAPRGPANGYFVEPRPADDAPAEPSAPPPAAGPRAEPTTFLDLSVVTEVPLMVGAQVTLELPYGLLLQGELGAMPSAYVGAISAVATAISPAASAATGLVHEALDGSLVAGASIGWRPFREHGLELFGGYTLVSLGGSVTAADAIAAVTGATLPANIPDATITLHSTLHNVHASVGWRWVLADHLVLRASVGYLQTLASSSHVDVAGVGTDAATTAALAAANAVIDSSLNNVYTTYVKSPLASVSLGFRF